MDAYPPLGVAVTDRQGLVIGWTPGAERLLGYTSAEACGRPVADLLDAPVLLPGGEPVRGEEAAEHGGRQPGLGVRHKDGHRLAVDVSHYALALGADGMGGEPGTVLLITPSSGSLAEELRQSLSGWILQDSSLALTVYDTDLRSVWQSAAMHRLSGLPDEARHGRRLTEVFAGPDAVDWEERMRLAMATGEEQVSELKGTVLTGLGYRVFSVSATPLQNAEGRMLGVCALVSDVTERRRARERLSLLNDASLHIGSTLDIVQTARELTEVSVPRFTDVARVDLLEVILRGDEPAPGPLVGPVQLRRIAELTLCEGVATAQHTAGEADVYLADSPAALCLATGRSALYRTNAAPPIRGYIDQSSERQAKVRRLGTHSWILVPVKARGTTLGVVVVHPHPGDSRELRHGRPLPSRGPGGKGGGLPGQRPALHPGTCRGCHSAAQSATAADAGAVGGGSRLPLPSRRTAFRRGWRLVRCDRRSPAPGSRWWSATWSGTACTRLPRWADCAPPYKPSPMSTSLPTNCSPALMTSSSGCRRSPEPTRNRRGRRPPGTSGPPACTRCTTRSPGAAPWRSPVTRRPSSSVRTAPPSSWTSPWDPPLGLGGLPFESVDVTLPEGSLFALYTDGLVHSRHCDLGEGLEALREALTEPTDSLGSVCDRVVRELLPEGPTDDVALLLVRTRVLDAHRVAVWDVDADAAAVARVRSDTVRVLDEWGLEGAAFVTELVVSELVTNAIRYGEPPIQLRLIHDRVLICEVSDSSSTAPHLRRARVFDEGGRGLLLVAQLTERWGTRQTAAGKTIWCEQSLAAADGSLFSLEGIAAL